MKEKQIVIEHTLIGIINPGSQMNPSAFLGQDEVLMPRGNESENFLVFRESLREVEVEVEA